MELSGQILQQAQSTLPLGYAVGTLGVERKTSRKYKISLSAHSSTQRLRWKSSFINTSRTNYRDAAAELEHVNGISVDSWCAGPAPAGSAASSGADVVRCRSGREAAPAVGSLKEPRVRKEGSGGAREGAGRPQGSWGKKERYKQAVELRKRLASVIPGALRLSSRDLQEALRVWKEMEPGLVAAAEKKWFNKGNTTSHTRKKLKRSRDAAELKYMSEVAARDFREEAMEYFVAVRQNQDAVITAAAAQQEVSLEC